jgi:hypothetical protein
MKKSTTWSKLRDAVNSFEKDEVFSRQQLLSKMLQDEDDKVIIADYSVDLYRLALTHIGVLEWVSRSHYRKKCSIPPTFTTTKLFKLKTQMTWGKSRDWRDWFMKLEDRLNIM